MQSHAAISRGADVQVFEDATVEVSNLLWQQAGLVGNYAARQHAVFVSPTLHSDEIYAEVFDTYIRERTIPWI
ncbi:hypothetical protein, partial [Klebsiella pneumoniae]|uniref:hypothetical protein n=1 Tax=Klebsiella pneumoniae TaxID=573 RepID=UPI001C6F9CBC